MTIGGWVFMLVSVGFVWVLVAWCFSRVFAKHDDAESPSDSTNG